MQTIILDISGNRGQALQLDAAISFEPFIAYLEKRVQEEQTVKAGWYREALAQFKSSSLGTGDILIEDAHLYIKELEYVYACLSPVSNTEQQLAWGLTFPFLPITFYGTDLLYELLGKRADASQYEANRHTSEYRRDRLQLIYSYILERLYNFQAPVKTEQYHAGINKVTGLLQYYAVNINTDLVEVTAKGALPVIDFVQLYTHLSEGGGMEILEEMLPLDMFRFRGVCVISITEVTARKAVENISRVRLSRTALVEEKSYTEVIQSLKSLVRNSKIEFDLFPFLRVNGEPVYSLEKGGTGILFDVWGEDRLSPQEFSRQAKGFASRPIFYFSSDIFQENRKEYAFLEFFRKLGVRSLALMPVFHLHELVGIMAVHTWGDDTFDEKALALLEPAIGPVAQLLQIYIEEFNLEIEKVIKERYTSVQPSVQWKFNEAAWYYLYNIKKNLPAGLQHIFFKGVYPLYGAIDIRNSTIERNRAIIADLDSHLSLLVATLDALRQFVQNDLLREMIYHCQQWQQVLVEQQLSPADENELNIFLEVEAVQYLQHIAVQYPKSRETVETCLDNLSGDINKNALEASMQLINDVVNQYFESEQHKIQESYPCYFEKFRTDGVEYDIYIGQSIAPDRPFNHFHLKNLRLWQLSSMAHIARLTHNLLEKMPRQLHTTQLIFVHNHPIDISFRTDERKFDVEGAYNIRYQMIKKRIDKVHIRHTEERLTQPDKIALIYSDRKDVEDYLPFIHYMQETGVLTPEIEELELEELQGLSGLKALRVTVNG
ncbi:GAF domain-containing protein [Chitinophaga sp. 30R24]|uniref:GAF domain-containing protein n=1 Tax=Chitinophaga sp. 30R24 TaxID=3248838 RepID=UPI003B908FFB